MHLWTYRHDLDRMLGFLKMDDRRMCVCANRVVFMLRDYPTASRLNSSVSPLDRAENRSGLCQLSGTALEMQMERHMLKVDRGLVLCFSLHGPAPQKTTKNGLTMTSQICQWNPCLEEESTDWFCSLSVALWYAS